jgi:hypothetical protein
VCRVWLYTADALLNPATLHIERQQKTYKIAVITVASRVSIGEHKGLPVAVPHLLEALGIVVDFVKKGNKVHWVTLGTTAPIVVAIHRVGDMGLVVIRVDIDTIPAGGKLYQCCQHKV